jgi:hypothetical protein
MAIVGGSRPGGGGQGVRETLHAYAYGHRGTSARPSSTKNSAWRLKRRWATGRAHANLGCSYRSLGDYSKAIEYHTRCLAIAREVSNRAGEGKAWGNLGIVHMYLKSRQRCRLPQSTTCHGNRARSCARILRNMQQLSTSPLMRAKRTLRMRHSHCGCYAAKRHSRYSR